MDGCGAACCSSMIYMLRIFWEHDSEDQRWEAFLQEFIVVESMEFGFANYRLSGSRDSKKGWADLMKQIL